MKDKASCLTELREIDGKMAKLKQKLQSLNAADPTKRERMEKRVSNLEKKKSKVLVHFDINMRDYLRKLEMRYENTGVVRVLNALCPGCHMRLPTMEAVKLRNPKHYAICSSCGRIILSSPVDTPSREKVTV